MTVKFCVNPLESIFASIYVIDVLHSLHYFISLLERFKFFYEYGIHMLPLYVSSATTSTKRRRTRGVMLSKWKEQKIKVPVTIPKDIMRPVGKNAQLLVTEQGCVVRGFASLTVKKWGDIKDDDKQKLFTEVKV